MFKFLVLFVVVGVVVSTPAVKSMDDLRIVGGEDIDITEAPYQVSLVFRGGHTCGGTIVASDMVITAAHCVIGADPADYQVRVGSSSSLRGGELYPVGEFIWHPNFNYAKMDNDIAIVWLSQPMEFNDRVAPIDMFDEDEDIDDGHETIVTGWGHTSEGGNVPRKLQRVTVPKVSERACSKAYAPLYSITPRMLCAGTFIGGKDSCQGDSGGPLVYNDKLAGVVSWGLGCARPKYPGVYAKVSALRPWIDESIGYLRLKHILRALH